VTAQQATAEPGRRVFFALWPSDTLRHDIEHATRHAARHSGGRIVHARNFHITLAFLGEMPESRILELAQCARDIAVGPFDLVLQTIAWWERQELLCLEPIAGIEALQEWVGRLQAALRAQGFAIERRPFRAHLTLAREVRREHVVKPIKELRWQVKQMELVESRLQDRGSEYTVLRT
jgi:2'-5' RNA ligase